MIYYKKINSLKLKKRVYIGKRGFSIKIPGNKKFNLKNVFQSLFKPGYYSEVNLSKLLKMNTPNVSTKVSKQNSITSNNSRPSNFSLSSKLASRLSSSLTRSFSSRQTSSNSRLTEPVSTNTLRTKSASTINSTIPKISLKEKITSNLARGETSFYKFTNRFYLNGKKSIVGYTKNSGIVKITRRKLKVLADSFTSKDLKTHNNVELSLEAAKRLGIPSSLLDSGNPYRGTVSFEKFGELIRGLKTGEIKFKNLNDLYIVRSSNGKSGTQTAIYTASMERPLHSLDLSAFISSNKTKNGTVEIDKLMKELGDKILVKLEKGYTPLKNVLEALTEIRKILEAIDYKLNGNDVKSENPYIDQTLTELNNHLKGFLVKFGVNELADYNMVGRASLSAGKARLRLDPQQKDGLQLHHDKKEFLNIMEDLIKNLEERPFWNRLNPRQKVDVVIRELQDIPELYETVPLSELEHIALHQGYLSILGNYLVDQFGNIVREINHTTLSRNKIGGKLHLNKRIKINFLKNVN